MNHEFNYEEEDGEIIITRYTGSGGDVVIPAEIDGQPVTTIDAGAFEDCKSLTSVTIPEGVTSIGDSAFSGCESLTSVVIPSSVTEIGDGAFSGCTSLTKENLPSNEGAIPSKPYEVLALTWEKKCLAALVAAPILSSITMWIAWRAQLVTGMNLFSFPMLVFILITVAAAVWTIFHVLGNVKPQNVQKMKINLIVFGTLVLGTYTLVILHGLSIIANFITACFLSGLMGLTFTYSLRRSLLTYALRTLLSENPRRPLFRSKIAEVTIMADVTLIFGVTYYFLFVPGIDGTTFYQAPRCFWGEYRIPAGVTEIGDRSFYDYKSLTSVTIPEGVTTIGAYAFKGCESLTSIVIPKSVTTIENNAFSDCTSLTSVVIPQGITEIGEQAFSGCTSLTSVVIPDGVTEIRDGTFCGCTSLTSIAIPSSVTSIGNGAFSGCTSLTSVVIPDGVTTIGESAFRDCTSLTSVVISDSVTKIGNHAFCGCEPLTSVVIPQGVTTIKPAAFGSCKSLTQITVSNENPSFQAENGMLLSKDGKRLVAWPSARGDVVIPDGVTKIGNHAFYDCESLTSVVIPDGVTEIGERAFSSCTSLTSVVIPEGVTEIGERGVQFLLVLNVGRHSRQCDGDRRLRVQ